MTHQDRACKHTLIFGLSGLGILAAWLAAAPEAWAMSGGPDNGEGSMAQQAIERRIQPVGEVVVAGEEPSPAEAAEAPAPAGGGPGEQVVRESCGGCHHTGVAGAPKIGDQEAWAQRAEKGMDAMVVIAVNGKGAMPPRGGGDYSGEELRAAIEYMLQQSGVKP